MHFLEHFLIAAGTFVLFDAVWLKSASGFYKKMLGDLLAPRPNFTAAAIFYALYMIGLVVFVVNPALSISSLPHALGYGALLGLLMYATYDLTNRATLKHWPWKLVAVDMGWGTLVTACVSAITFVIFR